MNTAQTVTLVVSPTAHGLLKGRLINASGVIVGHTGARRNVDALVQCARDWAWAHRANLTLTPSQQG